MTTTTNKIAPQDAQSQQSPQPQEGNGLLTPQVTKVFSALKIHLESLRDAALRDARSHAVEPADVEVYYHDKGRVEAYHHVLQLVEIVLEADPSRAPEQSKTEAAQ